MDGLSVALPTRVYLDQSQEGVYSDALTSEYDASGAISTLLRRCVHGSGVDEPLVTYEGATVAAASRRYFHADHQGSVINLANSSGNTLEVETYDPYGLPSPGNHARFQYTGQLALSDQGLMTPLYYYKARIYHPTLGRFLQTDPVGYKADLNIYAYVGNDPYNKTDPTGMEPKDDPCYYSGCSRIVLNDPGRGSDSSSIDDSLSAFTSIDTQGNPQGDNPLAGTSYLMVGGAALAGATAIAGTAAVASLATKEVATAVIPAVANPKLANIVRDLYKGAKTAKPIGTGSTADAIRNELATGLATGGKFHLQKGAEYIRAIDSWLSKNTSASFYDRLVANSIRNDLLNALGK